MRMSTASAAPAVRLGVLRPGGSRPGTLPGRRGTAFRERREGLSWADSAMPLIAAANRIRWIAAAVAMLALAAVLDWRHLAEPAPGSVGSVPAERIAASAYNLLEFLAQDRDDPRRRERIRGLPVAWPVRFAARSGAGVRFLTGSPDEPQTVLADAPADLAIGGSGMLRGTIAEVDASGAIRLADAEWSGRP